MIRKCDGTDPNLVLSPLMDYREDKDKGKPCTCGKVFDDVIFMVVYPHHPV